MCAGRCLAQPWQTHSLGDELCGWVAWPILCPTRMQWWGPILAPRSDICSLKVSKLLLFKTQTPPSAFGISCLPHGFQVAPPPQAAH